MKSILFLGVVLALAVLANSEAVQLERSNVVLSDSAAVKPQSSRANLNIGYKRPGDRLLHRRYVNKPRRANAIQYQDVTYTGSRNTRISAVFANEVGFTQFASVWLLRGGVGYNNVTLRMQSARGYGYHYLIEIWGR